MYECTTSFIIHSSLTAFGLVSFVGYLDEAGVCLFISEYSVWLMSPLSPAALGKCLSLSALVSSS